MGKCHAEGCNNEIFSHNFCRYHGYKRKMRGGDLYQQKPKEKKKPKRIPKKSSQREEDEPYYKQIKDEIRAELLAQGRYNCIFCNKPMGTEFSFHHFLGRVGKNYTDRKYLQPGHNKCHVEEYHRSTVEQLKALPWYPGFLLRIKAIDPMLWEKEMKKHEKAQPVQRLVPFQENEDEDIF